MNAHAQFLPNLEDDFFALLVRKNQGDKEEREREREREILFDNPLYQQITAGIGEGHHMPAYRMYELTYAINYLNN